MSETDEGLMRRTGEGDLDALGELFDRHQPRLYAFLCRLVGNAATAEDLAQETFLRLWRHRATYDPRQEFAPWLYMIARRLAFTEIKKPYRRAEPLADLDVISTGGGGYRGCTMTLADSVVSAVAVQEPVRIALRSLSPDERVCVLLREYEQWSHREIATVLGCSEGKVRVLAHRARQRLRERLRPLLGGEDDGA